MKCTNVNIKSPFGPMKYYFEYIEGGDHTLCTDEIGYRFRNDLDNIIDFYNMNEDNENTIMRNINEWYDIDLSEIEVNDNPNPGELSNKYVPYPCHFSRLNLYFPRFSVETYFGGIKYAVTLTTYIHGVEINLGSYLIDRNDVLASENIKTFGNEEYYEYIPIDVINPWYLIYSEEWKNFRQNVCGEPVLLGDGELNSTGSILNISLHPIIDAEETVVELFGGKRQKVNKYTEFRNFEGGQNAINMADEITDYLSLYISENKDEISYYESRLLIRPNLVFNKAYIKEDSPSPDNLRDYIYETYDIKNYVIDREIVVNDDDNIYAYIRQRIEDPWEPIELKSLVDDKGFRPFAFDSWKGYHEGMLIKEFLHIIPTDNSDNEAVICVRSNSIPITQDLYKYLIVDEYHFDTDGNSVYFGNNPITIINDQITIAGQHVEGDENGVVFYNDATFTIHPNQHYATYMDKTISIIKGEFIYDGVVMEPDENNEVNLIFDDVTNNMKFFYRKGSYYFGGDEYSTKNSKKIEIKPDSEGTWTVFYDNEPKQWCDGANGAFVWLLNKYRIYLTNFNGLVDMNGKYIRIEGSNIYYPYDPSNHYNKPLTPIGNTVYIEKCPINKVYLDSIDMNVYNINAVNKIQQTVVQVERPNNYKANIVKPVFFRVRDLGNLIIHPDVTEQICINLDAYKSKVDKFILQVENVSFQEYARNASGVLFKITGNTLPKSLSNGTYYILNQDAELITTGKYTYER